MEHYDKLKTEPPQRDTSNTHTKATTFQYSSNHHANLNLNETFETSFQVSGKQLNLQTAQQHAKEAGPTKFRKQHQTDMRAEYAKFRMKQELEAKNAATKKNLSIFNMFQDLCQ